MSSDGRDDSLLYSGSSSASFATKTEVKTKKRREESQNDLRLKKPGDLILELIEKQKQKVKSIEEFAIEEITSAEHFQAEVMARKKFYKFLLNFESQIKNLLRENT